MLPPLTSDRIADSGEFQRRNVAAKAVEARGSGQKPEGAGEAGRTP